MFETRGVPIFDKQGAVRGYRGIDRDITDREEEARLRKYMQAYVSEFTNAQEAERKSIVRNLHYDALQPMCLLSLEIGTLADKLPQEPAMQFDHLKRELDGVIDVLRNYCNELRPEMLDVMGLARTFRWMASSMNGRFGINTTVAVIGEDRRLSPEVETALYRIAQEAMHNIVKHSQAGVAEFGMELSEGRIRLSVADNGRGFDVPGDVGGLALSGRLGLRGMLERARLIGATLEIRSSLGEGTIVSVEMSEMKPEVML